jgi:hypothetical protein
MPEPSIQAFKFHAHPHCDFISLHFYIMIIHCSIFGSRTAKPLVSISSCLTHVFSCFDTSPSYRVVQPNPDFFRHVSRLENGISYACAISLLLLSGLSVAYITFSFLALSFPSIFAYLYLCLTLIDGLKWILCKMQLIISVIHTSLMLWLFFWTSTKQQ